MSDLDKVLEVMRTENSMVDWVGNRVVYMSLVFKIILYNLVGGK
jgi:hypothetical protein